MRLVEKNKKVNERVNGLGVFYALLSDKRRGFSFMEVIIAVFVLEIGFMAGISLITAGLRNSLDSRNQSIAGLLAQEGVELVRNVRDNNWAQGLGSFVGTGLNTPVGITATCRVDIINKIDNCAGAPKILNKNASNLFSHTVAPGNVGTQFSRQIIIENPNASERKVVSEVTWGNSAFPALLEDCNTQNRCAYAQINLTNWNE